MRRIFVGLFLLSLLLFLLASETLASFEKISQENNKFGIHLAVSSEEDLEDAAKLVNSSGGDWGYVTLVIQENDRDKKKWQGVFDQMRELHLIPIVRLATVPQGDSWRRPKPKDAKEWAKFLNSLNWVTKNRYLVLFNEPNHAKEWGGQVDAQSYAQVAFEFAKTLKETNPDFFIMLAGLDAAAPHQPPLYEDEEQFLRKLFLASSIPPEKITEYLDGWASHSYPNPGFVGSPHGQGRNSIRTYLWELNLLRFLKVKKDLPVFITETGWPHAEGMGKQLNYFNAAAAAQKFQIYFSQVTGDSKVVAITPFILNYQGEPFDHFSWRKLGEPKAFYPQYQLTQQIIKTKGEPKQEQRLEIVKKLPDKFTKNSVYKIPIILKNEGQAIWNPQDGYELKLVGKESQKIKYFVVDFVQIKPFEEKTVRLHFKTGEEVEKLDLSLAVAKNGEVVSNLVAWPIEVVPLININFRAKLFQKRISSGQDFKFLIYNQKEEIVFEREGVTVKDSQGRIEDVNNLVIGQEYRLVLLKPYYLPRQTFLIAEENENEIVFKKMLPLDFNLDGRFSWEDALALIKNPRLLRLWWLN